MTTILFIMASMTGGGAEKVFIDLLKNIDYTKYKVTVVILYAYGVHLSSIPPQVEVIKLFKKEPSKVARKLTPHCMPIFGRIWKRKIRHALKGRRFDNIVSYMEGQALLLHSFVTHLSTNNISWVHTDLLTRHWCCWVFKNREHEKGIYEKMNHIVCVSQSAKDSFSKAFGINDNLHVIYNIIDRNNILEKSEQSAITKTTFTICNIGRLNPLKRQDRIVEIASILKSKGLNFDIWILGTGDLEQALKKQAERLRVEDCVKFLGFQKNPYPYLKASDLFLLTSDAEGYPTVVCEAFCLGKPVVSTNITGSDELLADDTGILTSLDITEIAEHIETLMNNPEKLEHYARKARTKAECFDPRQTIVEFEKLLGY